jgi:hypothetical protein
LLSKRKTTNTILLIQTRKLYNVGNQSKMQYWKMDTPYRCLCLQKQKEFKLLKQQNRIRRFCPQISFHYFVTVAEIKKSPKRSMFHFWQADNQVHDQKHSSQKKLTIKNLFLLLIETGKIYLRILYVYESLSVCWKDKLCIFLLKCAKVWKGQIKNNTVKDVLFLESKMFYIWKKFYFFRNTPWYLFLKK